MGRKQLAAVLVVVAVAVAVAAASRGSGKPSQPVQPAVVRGVADDTANLMRRLQRDKLERSHK